MVYINGVSCQHVAFLEAGKKLTKSVELGGWVWAH